MGEARVFRGERIAKAVYVGLVGAAIGLDSHMVFAFSPAGSAGPALHAGLGVRPAGTYAFHLDLIPRVDLGTHLVYLDWAHTPLTRDLRGGLADRGPDQDRDRQPRQVSR